MKKIKLFGIGILIVLLAGVGIALAENESLDSDKKYNYEGMEEFCENMHKGMHGDNIDMDLIMQKMHNSNNFDMNSMMNGGMMNSNVYRDIM